MAELLYAINDDTPTRFSRLDPSLKLQMLSPKSLLFHTYLQALLSFIVIIVMFTVTRSLWYPRSKPQMTDLLNAINVDTPTRFSRLDPSP